MENIRICILKDLIYHEELDFASVQHRDFWRVLANARNKSIISRVIKIYSMYIYTGYSRPVYVI